MTMTQVCSRCVCLAAQPLVDIAPCERDTILMIDEVTDGFQALVKFPSMTFGLVLNSRLSVNSSDR